MKNTSKLFGVIATAAVIVLSLVACTNAKLEGTAWEQSDGNDNAVLIFDSPPHMIFYEGPSFQERATYTVSGKKVTMTLDGESLTGTISGNVITINFDGEKATFAKMTDRSRLKNVLTF